MTLNLYSILPQLSALIVFLVGSFVYFKNRYSAINTYFYCLCISIFVWLFSYGIAFSTKNNIVALFLFKIGYSGIIFSPVAYSSFVASLLGQKDVAKTRNVFLTISFVFVLILWKTDLFIVGLSEYFWGFYPVASTLHPIFLVYISSIMAIYSIKVFIRAYQSAKDSLNFQRLRYVGWALSIGALSSVDFIANYRYEFYPFGWVFINIYIILVAYTIIKYRLMEISIAITRTGIFVFVYSVVLGIPFALAFGWQERLRACCGDNWWMVPLVSSTVLATAGPFIYFFIQKRAEDKLLYEQRRYQNTLRQASSGMSRIKDLKKLLNLIVRIVNRTVNLEHTSIYLYNGKEKKYNLEAARYQQRLKSDGHIDSDSALVRYLIKTQEPIVYEEIKQRTQDYKNKELSEVEAQLKEMDAALAVPSLVEDKLLGILILGKRKSGKLFSDDDLAVFSILANQAAISIENALFYQDAKKTQEQLFQAEKMATIGTMADGLSHQINNRLHALGFIAGDALDSINLKSSLKVSDEARDLINEIKRSLERIQDNVKQGGEIVQGLLRYTRKGDAGFTSVDFNDLLKASIEMASYKVKLNQLEIEKDYSEKLPKIYGNFTQLQEVLFNIIDNAYDAVMQRKSEKKEPDFKGKLHISVREINDKLEINILDNGIGINDEDQDKLFTPFFTTKISSKKGTGLGLYVIQKIVEENHKGKVAITSEYMTGTLVILRLPIAGRSK